ncbi:MAG: dTDP-4-dehydrorhamnose reductase [Chloroflexota bacterium]
MRIFITGGNGQLGTALQQQLNHHDLFIADLPDVDISHRQQLETAVCQAKPNIIIHCAAYTNVDGCAKDPELAYKINGLGTQNVALICQERNIEMVHISTNEVFSGRDESGYNEWAPLNPNNPYGHSKAAAEHHVTRLLNKFYIVRSAWLYAPEGKNFVHAILHNARKNGQIQVVTDEIGNPTYVHDLAVAITQLIQTKQYGTYHLVNQGHCSRWEFANEILKCAGLAHVKNRPILSTEFQRLSTPPAFGHLHNVAGAAIGVKFRPWQEALAEFIKNL